MLFYVAGLLVLWTGSVGWLELLLAWLFVGLRYVHAAIHVTSNALLRRFTVYTAGLAVLAALWLLLVFRLVILAPSI